MGTAKNRMRVHSYAKLANSVQFQVTIKESCQKLIPATLQFTSFSDDQLIHISDRIAAACEHPQRICGSDWIFTYLFAFKFEFSGNFL